MIASITVDRFLRLDQIWDFTDIFRNRMHGAPKSWMILGAKTEG